MVFSKIERHPLQSGYMLYSPVCPQIPPFFGTLKKCKEVQVGFEQRLKKEFDKLSDEEKEQVAKRFQQ